jgi:hypothetical protein
MSRGFRRILTAKTIALAVLALAGIVVVVAFRRAQAPVPPPPGAPPQTPPAA